MWLSSLLRNRQRRVVPRLRPTFRPRLEALEDRCVPSTLTVTTNADSGAGSLRADIAAARRGDTIVFAPSLDGQTITLTSGELLIKNNLTITGPGAGNLTISGNNASRVFELSSKTLPQVVLSGLTISNGDGLFTTGSLHTGDGNGGAIRNEGTLTVSNCVLSGNSAHYGGGIYNDGTLTIDSSSLSGNSAFNPSGGGGDGGGIYNFGTATVNGSSTLSNNAADFGGGIANAVGTLTVNSSTLSGNTAFKGGGIDIISGTVTLSGCTLSDNSARFGGGGIWNDVHGGGTVTVENSSITANTAPEGGGIFNITAITISGSSLTGNSASNGTPIQFAGGGIYNLSGGTVTVENSSVITGNSAPTGYGADVDNLGVLYLDSTSTIGVLDGNPAQPI